MSANDWVLTLLRATFEGGALLLLIWVVTRLWPRMPGAARCGLWWVGSLRMIVGLVPLPTIPVAWKPVTTTWVPDLRTPAIQLNNAIAGADLAPVVMAPARMPADVIPLVLAAVWGLGVAFGVVLLARRLLALRRMWRAARPFEDPRVAAWQTEWAVAIGRGRVPEVRASAATETPVALGALRPGLLLPADSSRLSDDTLRMVLAHEMSHIRRGDPLLGWVPAIAQLLFWFFPPVRFAAREYLAAREQVSDADALRATGVSPHDYGALLLDYGVDRMSQVPGVASCGSAGARDLKRRLDMLSRTLRVPPSHRAAAAFISIAVVGLAFAPIRFVAANEDKSTESHDSKKKSQYDKQPERGQEAEWAAKAEADWKRQMEKAGESYDHQKRAYEQAFGKGKIDKHERSPFAYMVKIEGMKGTRGAIDEMDMDGARSLDYDGRSAVYFRLGDEMWISHDEGTIESVQQALEPEDRMDARMQISERRREAYEHERMKLEEKRVELEYRKAQLEAREASLRARFEDQRPTPEALAEKQEIEQEMNALQAEGQALERTHKTLFTKLQDLYDREKIPMAERELVHQQVMEQVAAIARRAIADGRAERFEP